MKAKTLSKMWLDDKDNIESKKLVQLIAFTGTGNIENADTSEQLREYFHIIDSDMIEVYVEECLTEKIDKGGLILQDLVNEIGIRLGFLVDFGRYRGKPGKNGYDGKWDANDGHTIIIESKTTDTYRINLDDINDYRQQLIQNKDVDKDASSILIVVGRVDTGGLEAQIRGSRYAWCVRLISIAALIKLLRLKERFNDIKTINQIYGVLKPQEYTKVDKLIDLIFLTKKDAELNDEDSDEENDETPDKYIVENADNKNVGRSKPVNFYHKSIERIEKEKNCKMRKISRSLYGTEDGALGVTMIVSKKHTQGNKKKYWFAYHPYFKDNLSEYVEKYIVCGCGNESKMFLLPVDFLEMHKESMLNTRKKDGSLYWHINIFESENGKFSFQLSKPDVKYIDISEYLM